MFPTPPSDHHGLFAGRYSTFLCSIAGLAPLRPHHLRHTAVSLLIGQGAHPKEIQEWCGHSSFAVTMNVYGHLLPERHEKLAALLDAVHRDGARPADVVQLHA